MKSEKFTKTEIRQLEPYVSNIEGPVFVLINLPEVVKGALFSRYSRSSQGLRRLLLKDFIRDRSGSKSSGLLDAADVERARDFYDRILDGYGDDSIGELGGAHVAIESVSMIATKILEDPRIGGSPLEKSTRYVSFATRIGGEFQFYKDPQLMAVKHYRSQYIETCRALFRGYSELIEPMTNYIMAVSSREIGANERSHHRAVMAQVYDALRGLLPASALTNMGIFGNGRFFESLIIRLRLSGLAEGERLAVNLQRELGRVIPSFIRRANANHRHYKSLRAFQKRLSDVTRQFAEQGPPSPGVPPPGSGELGVRLVEFDKRAESKVLAALAFGLSQVAFSTLLDWADQLEPNAREKIISELCEARDNRRHKLPRALEFANYSFDLVGDYGIYRDLHRHRMLTQQRQLLGTRHGYSIPEIVIDAGYSERYKSLMDQAAEAYEEIVSEYPEQAQYVVPMAYRIRWSMQINLRELMWMIELRSTREGHPAYRRMVQEMFRQVESAHPRLARLIKFVDLNEYELARSASERRQEPQHERRLMDLQISLPGVEDIA